GSISETSAEDFRYQIDVNLNSAFYVTRAFLEVMKERGSGLIVFTASVASVKAYPGGAAYCAGKHGLLGIARVTREDTMGTGVRSTALILGATYTPSWESSGLPEERFIPVDDVASIVMDLYQKSDRTVVEEILIRPREGDI
ncbi:MAG: SDR family oxidoreductase, partial [Rhodothermia bacterium]|nr:SDR family oxidoreductase [Rhodothermia bacterium]